MEIEDKCKVCDEPTKTYYNINYKATPICEDCARKITRQELDDMFRYFDR